MTTFFDILPIDLLEYFTNVLLNNLHNHYYINDIKDIFNFFLIIKSLNLKKIIIHTLKKWLKINKTFDYVYYEIKNIINLMNDYIIIITGQSNQWICNNCDIINRADNYICTKCYRAKIHKLNSGKDICTRMWEPVAKIRNINFGPYYQNCRVLNCSNILQIIPSGYNNLYIYSVCFSKCCNNEQNFFLNSANCTRMPIRYNHYDNIPYLCHNHIN